MTREEITVLIEALEESAKEIASSPDKARAVLQDAGILTPKGNFSKHYRSGERKLGTAKHLKKNSKSAKSHGK